MWKNNQLQDWAHKMGIGRPAGFDLPEERRKPGAEQAVAQPALQGRTETDRPWSAGDNIQLATGQGDLQTNPLQMAIAYAALGNGGKIVTPHVGLEVEDPAGGC